MKYHENLEMPEKMKSLKYRIPKLKSLKYQNNPNQKNIAYIGKQAPQKSLKEN
jgi:hypothetical protein